MTRHQRTIDLNLHIVLTTHFERVHNFVAYVTTTNNGTVLEWIGLTVLLCWFKFTLKQILRTRIYCRKGVTGQLVLKEPLKYYEKGIEVTMRTVSRIPKTNVLRKGIVRNLWSFLSGLESMVWVGKSKKLCNQPCTNDKLLIKIYLLFFLLVLSVKGKD